MSEIKGVSNKTLSTVVENQPSTETQKTSSSAQVSGGTQELSKEGKIAKATESLISGEATRQALLGYFRLGEKDSASKPVELKGSAAEKIDKIEIRKIQSMKKPTEAEKKEIADTIRSGDKQKAVDLTLKYYGIDASAAGSIKYDQHHDAAGSFDPVTKEIKLGTAAFYSKGEISPDKLAVVLYHDNTRARHAADHVAKTEQEESAQEIEMFHETISRAKSIGIEQSVIDEAEYYRKIEYRALTPENKQKVDNGNYNDVQ